MTPPSAIRNLLIALTVLSAPPGCQTTVLAQRPANELYVATSGSDANPGTLDRPFATLEAARNAIRSQRHKGLLPGSVTVWVRGGLYLRTSTFALEAQDSGDSTHTITYRAYANEHPRLFGGIQLPSASFKPVGDAATLARISPAARGHVLQVSLAPGMHPPARFADIFKGNGGMPRLFRNDAALPLSRWPNAGYTTMASVTDSGITPPHGATFQYRDEVAPRAALWAVEAAAGNLWLTGFWRVPFETESVRVHSVDTAAHSMTLAAPVPNGIGSKYTTLVNGTRPGDGKEQFFAFNLLSEIDIPGEWSFDFNTSTLYLWPPQPLATDELLFANLTAPVISLHGASHITLQGLDIEGGTAQGIAIDGGSYNLIAGCQVRNTGDGGIDVEAATNTQVQSNDIEHVGTFGVRIVAGDRKLLVPANDIADNNHIDHFGEQERITQGIYLGGIGNRASHNLIHDGTYHGIEYQGNDQRMEFNEIHHIGLDAGDLGTFYTNGDWAAQGNVIAYNFAHDSGNANGSYIDDGASGRTTTGNIFYKLSAGLFLGGGHNNIDKNNLIIDCKTGIHVDNRGVARHYDTTAHHLTVMLNQIDPSRPPWSQRYPHFLASILADPTEPTGNIFTGNVILNAQTPFQVSAPAVVDPSQNPVFASGPRLSDAKFVDAADLDFTLAADSPLLKVSPGLAAIHFKDIGLRLDAYRHTLPTAAETGRNSDRPAIQYFDSNTDIKASDKLGK